MQPSERYDIILQMLANQDLVTVSELMKVFNVSIETIRRDLNYLAKEQRIKKVYGGAIPFNRTASVKGGSERMVENSAEKEAIGRKCAELIHDGDTVYLGAGTTVLQVAKHLKDRKDLTVVTNSLYVAAELAETDIELHFMGGRISKRDASTPYMPGTGWDHFSAPKAIIGAGGISPDHGVTDYSADESRLLRIMLERAMQIIVLADNSKFGLVLAWVTCPLPRVSRIITGSAQQEDILHDFSNYRQRFLFVDDYTPAIPAAPAEEEPAAPAPAPKAAPVPVMTAPPAQTVTPAIPRGTILDLSLEELGLSLRTRVSLEGHGITDLRTLLDQSPSDLKCVRNMTQEGLDEIEYQLGLLGLSLEKDL